MSKAIVVFSGGPDSTAAALWALEQGYEVELLTFQFRNKEQYGELKAAMEVAGLLNLPHTIFDFKSPMQHFGSKVHILMHSGTKTGDHKTDESHRLSFGSGMVLTTASNYAVYNGTFRIIWGATADDAGGGRFDYTQEFCDIIADCVARSIGEPFEIRAPFTTMHKHLVLQHFAGKEKLFARTWSCKMGGRMQSGNCHASIARRVAARLANIDDATEYENREIQWPLTETQFQNPQTISDDDYVRIFASEKHPQFT